MKKRIFMVSVFLVAALGLLSYLHGFTTTDANNLYLIVTPEDAAGWELTGLKDGNEFPLTAQEAIDSQGTVLLRRVVPEEWINYERVNVSGHRPMFIWIEDTLVFSNCPGSIETVGELPDLEMPEGQPFTMEFSMNPEWVGKTITMATSLFTPEPFGSIGFVLVSSYVQSAQSIVWANSRAMPGAAFAVLFLLIFGLFLLRCTMGKGALPLLYLSVAALVSMFCYLDGVEGNAMTFVDISTARVLCLLLPLLYLSTRMERVRRLFLWIAIPLWAIYFSSVMAWAVFSLPVPMWFDRLAYIALLLPVVLLVCAFLEYRGGNAYFQRFLLAAGAAASGFTILFVLSALWGKTLFGWLMIYFLEAEAGYPMPLAFGVFTVLLVILFLLAIWDIVENSAETAREIETLKLRSELIAQSLGSVQRVNETLAVVRHDELHHLRTLIALYRDDTVQAEKYATLLTRELDRIPSMRFTENRLVNAILSVQSGAAAEAGVQFEAKAKLPEPLAIPETELTTVLVNLLENAVEAAAKAHIANERKVSVTLEIENLTLLITISSSLPAAFDQESFYSRIFPTTKADTGLHGYGIHSARAIVSRRGGELRYSIKDGVMTVNTAMEIG